MPSSISKRVTVSPDASLHISDLHHALPANAHPTTKEIIADLLEKDLTADDDAFYAWLSSKHTSTTHHDHVPAERPLSRAAFFSSLPTHRLELPAPESDPSISPAPSITSTKSGENEGIKVWRAKKRAVAKVKLEEQTRKAEELQRVQDAEREMKNKRLADSQARIDAWSTHKLDLAQKNREKLAVEAETAERELKAKGEKSKAAFREWKKSHSSIHQQALKSKSSIIRHPKPWQDIIVPTPEKSSTPSLPIGKHQIQLASPPSLYAEYERTRRLAPEYARKYPNLVAKAGERPSFVSESQREIGKTKDSPGGPKMHKGKSDFVAKKDVIYKKHHAL